MLEIRKKNTKNAIPITSLTPCEIIRAIKGVITSNIFNSFIYFIVFIVKTFLTKNISKKVNIIGNIENESKNNKIIIAPF